MRCGNYRVPPKGGGVGRTVLIRTDGAEGTHKLLEFLTTQKLS